MCGIVGTMALGKLAERQEKLRQESMIFLTTELLQLTQARGTDATGASILFNDGNFMGLKMGISSPEFISRFGGTKTDFEGFLKVWRDNEYPVKTYLGHCRKTSVGSATDNANNHPIKVGNIVGIHNGTLDNHNVIFEKLECKRDGDVDSEAIIRLLHFYTRKGSDPFTIEMLKEVCLRLQGSYSVIAYNADNIDQIVTFRDGKPAVAALIRPLNLLLIASDEAYLKQTLYRYNKHAKLYMPRIKFPMLKKDDVDVQVMPDDTCAIFDLSNKVDKDTDVRDLFEDIRVPRLDKVWKKGTTTTNYNKNSYNNKNDKVAEHNRKVVAEANKKLAEDEKKRKSKSDESKIDGKGKIWSKSLKEFQNVCPAGNEKAKKIKSVEIGDKGELNHLENGKISKPQNTQIKNGIVLKKVPKEKVNGLIGNIAKVHDEPVDHEEETADLKEVKKMVSDMINPSTNEVVKGKSSGTTVEVNTNINVAAMEAAVKAASIQPKFESDDEVLEELEVDNLSRLQNLQLFALTNRVSKVLFKKSFYKGFVRGSEKVDKAESNIKTLKTVAKIFVKALQKTNYNEAWKKNHIKEASKGEREITEEDIQKVFSAGDLRENEELKYLKNECTKK